jgi:polar amino acid transport system permease protein
MLAAVDWHIVWERLFHPDHVFVRALWTTVYIAVVAQIMGVVLGLVAALMRMSRVWLLRALSGLYVLVFRGTPLLVQIFFVFSERISCSASP